MRTLIRKIISGGQTGADRTALEVAREFGIPTGGTAPPGWKTEIGSSLSLQKFGLVEGEPDKTIYVKRTFKNVKDADGTVWIGDISSPGYKCTLKAARQYGRPFIVNPSTEEFKDWLSLNCVEILNVAGNRRSKNPKVVEMTRILLIGALQ